MPKPTKKQQDDEQSEQDQSDDSEKELVVNTDNSPKIIPVAKLPEKLKNKKIVMNVSDTQYPIVTEIAEQLGWIIQDEEGTGDWDVWWTDRQIEPNTLYRMNLHQKINHFPGIYVLARKNLLGLHLMAMQKKFPQQYNFFPETWMLPMQFPQFRQYFQSIEEGKVRTYIVKPEALSQGRGIFLTRSIQDVLNGHKYVVQRYLKNPLLLDGLKFDLRIYVLLAGSEPLRLYIYQQGLARLATRPYQPPTAQNLHQNFIHLTNYSLNKGNPDYIYNKSDKQMDIGHKRSLKGVYERLAKSGIDIEKLKQQIQECIIKTVISGLPSIRHQYSYCQPEEYEGNMCFHILGFDVMIMDDLKPIIIEVNHTPSFQTGTPLDYMIKKNLIKDTLKLMRINSKNKKAQFQKAKNLTKKRIETGKRDIFKGEERKQQLEKVQKVRDEEEREVLFNPEKPSGYKVIFPFKDEKKNEQYSKFYQGAEKVMKELKDMRKKIISEEESSQSNKKQAQSSTKNGRMSKNSTSAPKQPSIERSINKKLTAESIEQKSPFISNSREGSQNMESSGGNSSEDNGRKKILLDTILQNRQENQTCPHDTAKSAPQIQQPHSYTDKKLPSPPTCSKHNFQIRSNHHKKKNSLNGNQKIISEEMCHNFESSKYQELMSKFVRSKDLDDGDAGENRAEGLLLLEKKFCTANGRRSKNSNDEQASKKQVDFFVNEQKDTKEKHNGNNDIIGSSIKGYKQKIAITTNSIGRTANEKFQDSHLSYVSNSKTGKAQRGYGNNSNMNFVNLVGKPFPIENFFGSNLQQEKTEQQKNLQLKQKQGKHSKQDSSKFGKFLKPKTYNLHQSRFPQEDKFIVRVDPNTNHSLGPYYHKPYTETTLISSNTPNGSLLTFQQYNDLCAHITNNEVTTEVHNHGYNGRSKINVNQRNLSQFVNGSSKPSTGHKVKSSSLIYKGVPARGKEASMVVKIVEKIKIKGYQ